MEVFSLSTIVVVLTLCTLQRLLEKRHAHS